VVKLKTAQTPILLIIFGTFILCQDFLTPTIDKEPFFIAILKGAGFRSFYHGELKVLLIKSLPIRVFENIFSANFLYSSGFGMEGLK